MGSGSGEAKRAQRRAEQLERERQQRIAAGTAQVNRIFDAPERQAQYGDFLDAVRAHYRRDLDRQFEDNSRQLKFSTARSGLTGGSADVDSRRVLGEEFTRGGLAAENQAQSALADLRSQDESARMNLIQLVQSGLDATTAAQRAGAAMQASTSAARADSTAKGLGDLFGSTASIYKQQQESAARRRGMLAPVGSLYGSPGFGGSR